MKTLAPAKINWTLEVLGQREDGYHEIRSVMQTIDVHDEVWAWLAPDRRPVERPGDVPEGVPWIIVTNSPVRVGWHRGPDMQDTKEESTSWTLTHRAASLLDPTDLRGAGVEVTKHIPVASGLGGGSSDAAAVLRSLDQLWRLSLGRERLTELAAELGSDVAFFLYGGTALAEGRGERITSLPDSPVAWLVVVMPPINMPDKTKRMYEALEAEDFGDGTRSEALAEQLRVDGRIGKDGLCNAFERVAYRMFDGLEMYREALLSAGAQGVHLAGAGPALFALAASEEGARELADRVQAPDAKVFVARTLGAAEATAIVQ
jgi:4-diphosphocytidyl-2-C-methyl-D-erythritol kinase